MIRVILPQHLQTLAGVGREVQVEATPTLRGVIDALEARYPTLRGAIRDHGSNHRRPMIRFFAAQEDWSFESPDAPLPPEVAEGREALYIIGAIAGG